MNQPDHLLLLLLAAPLLGALAMLLPGSMLGSARQAWSVAMLASLLAAAVAVVSAFCVDPVADDPSLALSYPWFPGIGLSFSLAMDGLSMWLVLTTVAITPALLLFIADKLPRVAGERYRSFLFWILATECAMLGCFLARDVILFYAFFELSILPAFFLITQFGGPQRRSAATTLLIYNLAASLLTFAAFLYLAHHHYVATGRWSFALEDLKVTAPLLSDGVQIVVMLGLLIGFLVKTPLWPLHTWLPGAHAEAPANGVVDAATLVIKLGPYAILRFALPLAPDAAASLAPWVATLAVAGILVAGLVAWVEPNMKKLLGYASVSHMGFCLLGLFALDPQGLGASGAAFYVVVYALSAGALFLCAGLLHDRFGSLSTAHIAGSAAVMPALAFFAVYFAMVSVGLPGLSGFVGEFLAMAGSFDPAGALGPAYTVAAVLGLIVTAVYMLHLVALVVFGPMRLPPAAPHAPAAATDGSESGRPAQLPLSGNETLALAIPALLCLVLGLYPQPVLDAVQPAVADATAPAVRALAESRGADPSEPDLLPAPADPALTAAR